MAPRLTEMLRQLATARKYVVDGERDLSLQKAYVEMLQRRGLDSSNAEDHLATLEKMQVQYVEHVERLETRVLYMVKPADDLY